MGVRTENLPVSVDPLLYLVDFGGTCFATQHYGCVNVRTAHARCASLLSCGRVGSSHMRYPAFGQGAEYLMKPLQQSCVKLKLHIKPAPCTAI